MVVLACCFSKNYVENTMKVKVKLFVSGVVFNEIVIARNYNDAKKTALARNPTATIVSITAIF